MSAAEKFNAAVQVINSLPQNGPFQPSQELLLKFYSYHKQATEGPCNTEKPYFWDIASKQKWNAWKSLGCMSREEAMEKYVEELVKIIETMSYNEAISNFMDTMGPLYETVWLEEPETETSGNAEAEMSDSSFEVIKQENDVNIEEKCADISFLQNSPETAEKVKPTFQFVNPYSQELNKSKKVQKDSEKPGTEKSSSLKSLNSPSSSRLKPSGSQVFSQSVVASGSDILMQSGSKQYSRNIPGSAAVKEILFISVVSLQHSLEEVSKRLDRLEALINVHTLTKTECPHPERKFLVFGLPHWVTVFILLWPFISQWVVLGRWQKR